MELIVSIRKGSEAIALQTLQNLHFIQKIESEQEKLLADLKEAVQEIQLMERGLMKPLTKEQLWDALRD